MEIAISPKEGSSPTRNQSVQQRVRNASEALEPYNSNRQFALRLETNPNHRKQTPAPHSNRHISEGSRAVCGADSDFSFSSFYRFNALRPRNRAFGPSSSSIRNSWLYSAIRSVRDAEPVLIWPEPMATTKSARNVSSVSPDRCETIDAYFALRAISTASIVSLTLPIWFSLIRIALPIPSAMPRAKIFGLDTNASSPTSWIFLVPAFPPPSSFVISFQPSQSSSARPSSIEMIGYCRTQLAQNSTICSELRADLSDFLKTYFFVVRS